MKERTQRVAWVHFVAERWAVGRAFVLASNLYVTGNWIPFERDGETVMLAFGKFAKHRKLLSTLIDWLSATGGPARHAPRLSQ